MSWTLDILSSRQANNLGHKELKFKLKCLYSRNLNTNQPIYKVLKIFLNVAEGFKKLIKLSIYF